MAEKESYLHPGVTKAKAAIIYIGVILVLAAGTFSSQGISQIQTAILTRYDAMNYFSLLSCLATVGMVIMMPVGGKLSDLYGRKLLMIIGTILFTGGSIIASRADGLVLFLISRAVIPFGQGCTMVVGYATLGTVFKGKGRNLAYGALSGVLAFGSFMGGTISGYLADMNLSWVAIFYPGIMLLIGAILVCSQIKNVKREGKIKIDFAGIIFIAITVIGLVYSMTFGRIVGFSDPTIIVAIVAFVIGVIGLVLVERKAAEPILLVEMFKNPVVVGVILITFFTVVYQRPMQIYLPVQLQQIVGVSQGQSGLVSIARTITAIVGPMIIAGWVVKNKTKRLWKVLLLCGLSITIAFIPLSNIKLGGNVTVYMVIYFIAYALMGVAESCKGAVITPFLQDAVDQKNLGAATSLNSFFGTAGSQIAGAAMGLIYDITVPDASNLAVLERGLNIINIVALITGVIVILLAIFFVRNVQMKVAKKKSETV